MSEDAPMHESGEDPQPPESGEGLHVWGAAFGLTSDEYRELSTLMAARVRRVGLGAHVHRMDVVHDAFVIALCKPIEERPSSREWKRFVAWMCKLAECSAMTNLHPKGRRTYHSLAPLEELEEQIPDPRNLGIVIELRPALQVAYNALPAEAQDIVAEHAIEEKTIREIAVERKVPSSTVFERYSAGIHLMRTKLESLDRVPPKRLRRRILAIPLVLVAAVAREARARIANAWERLAASFTRSPVRFMGSVAVGVAVGVSPSGGEPQAMQASATASHTFVTDIVRRDELRILSPVQGIDRHMAEAAPQPSTKRPVSHAPASLRHDHAKPFDWMAANASRRGEVSPRGATK